MKCEIRATEQADSGLRQEIYCRRCRGALGRAEPGALIGCVACRLYTRATLTNTRKPELNAEEQARTRRPLRIRVDQVVMGFRVYLSGEPSDFEVALAAFKDQVPRSLRQFNPRNSYWFVQKRAGKRLEGWLHSMQVGRKAEISTGKDVELARSVHTGAI